MLNFVYNSQDPNKIVPVIEKTLCKELGVSMQIPYKVVPTGVKGGFSLGALVESALDLTSTLFVIEFTISQPRPFQLQVKIDRQGIGSLLGSLTYSAPLAKPIGGEVSLEPPKIFGASKFVGDAQTISRLNDSKALIKKANQLTQTESELGQYRFEIKRYLKISPQATYPLLTVNSLPRKTGLLGADATLNVKDFLELLSLVEAAL